MTPEQAANHPSKNVISRALGAENSVEADMKTMEVDEGNAFLLCTDGITRHIPDNELRDLLSSGRNPRDLCEEMKRRCYQRGAEDNLTAVIVQVGTPKFTAVADDEPTVSFEDVAVPTEPANIPDTPARLTPPSRVAFPGPSTIEQAPNIGVTAGQTRKGRPVLRFFVFLLFLGVAVAAFYGGIKYQQRQPGTQPSPVPTVTTSPELSAFAAKRAAVDADAPKWLTESLPAQLSAQGITKPTDSKDAEFLYLYGRALMLTGNHRDAMQAFEIALARVSSDQKTSLPLETEVRLADAAAALKLNKASTAPRSQEASMAEDKAIRVLDETLRLPAQTPPK